MQEIHNITGKEVENKDKIAAKEAQNRYDSRNTKKNHGEVQEGGVNNKNSGIIAIQPNSIKSSMLFLRLVKLMEGWMGDVRRTTLTCRKG